MEVNYVVKFTFEYGKNGRARKSLLYPISEEEYNRSKNSVIAKFDYKREFQRLFIEPIIGVEFFARRR